MTAGVFILRATRKAVRIFLLFVGKILKAHSNRCPGITQQKSERQVLTICCCCLNLLPGGIEGKLSS